MLLLICSGLGCRHPQRSLPFNSELTTGQTKHIEYLIEQLASRNSRPDVSEWSFSGYPADYDHAKQVRVDDAIRDLQKAGRKAFPLLVAHSGDKRYSCTRVYAAYRNWSVGDVCFLVLFGQVENYDHFPKSWGKMPGGLWQIHYEDGDLMAWWRERKTWSLQKLQIEAIEHRIEGERQHEYREKRKRILEYLEKRRESILRNALPLEYYGI